MAEPIEVTLVIPVLVKGAQGQRIIRGFINHGLDDWCATGTNSRAPFFEVPENSRRWAVTHRRTGRKLPTRPLTRAQALELCAALEREVHGASQIEHRGDFLDVVGMSDEMKRAIFKVLCDTGFVKSGAGPARARRSQIDGAA